MLLNPLIAKMGKRAAVAFWRTGCANIPAEQHDAVAEIAAFFRGKNFSQLLLYLFRIFICAEDFPARGAECGECFVVLPAIHGCAVMLPIGNHK